MATFTIINDSTATWSSNDSTAAWSSNEFLIWDGTLQNYSWAHMKASKSPEQIRKEQEKKEWEELFI